MHKSCKYPNCLNPIVKFPNKKIKDCCQEHGIEEAIVLSKLEKERIRAELETERQRLKDERKTKSAYSSQLWKNFSHYVLLHYADDNLMVRCSTDPSLIYKVNDKRIAVGHWLKCDEFPNLKYEFKNVLPQSHTQNVHHAGNMTAMKDEINRIHGEGTTDWLESIKSKVPLNVLEMDRLSKHYLNLLNEEIKRRKIKNPWR